MNNVFQHRKEAKPITSRKGSDGKQSFFTPVIIQKKLEIGEPYDKYEIEADRIADQVVQMKAIAIDKPGPANTTIQRKCTSCDEEEHIQKKSLSEQITPLIQRRSSHTSKGSVTSDTASVKINQLKGGGRSLDKSTKNTMERDFGTDFSNVRIHTDSNAANLSKELNAQAFTVGNDVFFNEGKYDPNSNSGKHLLAHELTHTVQQSGFLKTPNRNTLIQREVEPESVTSSKNVIKKMKAVVMKTQNWNDDFVYKAATQITNDVVSKKFATLVALSKAFNPGAPGQKGPTNAFVYTCNCGWIDMGHFLISAAGAFLAAYSQQELGIRINGKKMQQGELLKVGLTKSKPILVPLLNTVKPIGNGEKIFSQISQLLESGDPQDISLGAGGYLTEVYQQAFKLIAATMADVPDILKSEQRSAFTNEDLPSDAFGANFGQVLWIKVNRIGGASITNMMEAFFSRCSAVYPNPKSETFCKMMAETTPGSCEIVEGKLVWAKNGGTPKQHSDHKNPDLLESAQPLCGSNPKPISPKSGANNVKPSGHSSFLNINTNRRSFEFKTFNPKLLDAFSSLGHPFVFGGLKYASLSLDIENRSSASLQLSTRNDIFSLNTEADIGIDYEGLLKAMKLNKREENFLLELFKLKEFLSLLKEFGREKIEIVKFFNLAKVIINNRFPQYFKQLGLTHLQKLLSKLLELLPLYIKVKGSGVVKVRDIIPISHYNYWKSTGESRPLYATEMGFLLSELFNKRMALGGKLFLFGGEKINAHLVAGFDVISKQGFGEISLSNKTLTGKNLFFSIKSQIGASKDGRSTEEKILSEKLSDTKEPQEESKLMFSLGGSF